MYCLNRIEIDDWPGLIEGAGPTQVEFGTAIGHVTQSVNVHFISEVFDLAESLVIMFAKRIEHHHAHR